MISGSALRDLQSQGAARRLRPPPQRHRVRRHGSLRQLPSLQLCRSPPPAGAAPPFAPPAFAFPIPPTPTPPPPPAAPQPPANPLQKYMPLILVLNVFLMLAIVLILVFVLHHK